MNVYLKVKFSELNIAPSPLIGDYFVITREIVEGKFKDFRVKLDFLIPTENLPVANDLNGTELVSIYQNGSYKKTTTANIASLVGSSSTTKIICFQLGDILDEDKTNLPSENVIVYETGQFSINDLSEIAITEYGGTFKEARVNGSTVEPTNSQYNRPRGSFPQNVYIYLETEVGTE